MSGIGARQAVSSQQRVWSDDHLFDAFEVRSGRVYCRFGVTDGATLSVSGQKQRVAGSLQYNVAKWSVRSANYGRARRVAREHLSRETTVYKAPKLERLGTLRDLTQAGGEFATGDGANPYHRYTAIG